MLSAPVRCSGGLGGRCRRRAKTNPGHGPWGTSDGRARGPAHACCARPNDSVGISTSRRACPRRAKLSKPRLGRRKSRPSQTTTGDLASGCVRNDKPQWHAFARLTRSSVASGSNKMRRGAPLPQTARRLQRWVMRARDGARHESLSHGSRWILDARADGPVHRRARYRTIHSRSRSTGARARSERWRPSRDRASATRLYPSDERRLCGAIRERTPHNHWLAFAA